MTQAIVNLPRLRLCQNPRATQIATALRTHSERQVAGSRRAMHGFTSGRQAKTLLSRLVGLHFRHNKSLRNCFRLVEFEGTSLTGARKMNKGLVLVGCLKSRVLKEFLPFVSRRVIG